MQTMTHIAAPYTTITTLVAEKRTPKFLSLSDIQDLEETERDQRLNDVEGEQRRSALAAHISRSIAGQLPAKSDKPNSGLLGNAVRSFLFFGNQAVEAAQILGSNALSDAQNVAGSAIASAQILGSMAIGKVQQVGHNTLVGAMHLRDSVTGAAGSDEVVSLSWKDLGAAEDAERVSRIQDRDTQRFSLALVTSALVRDEIRARSQFYDPHSEPSLHYGTSILQEMERIRRINDASETSAVANARKAARVIAEYRELTLANQRKLMRSASERLETYEIGNKSETVHGLARGRNAAEAR